MARERWRKVRRAPGCKVSSLGRVRSPDGTLLSPFPDRDGYPHLNFSGERVPLSHVVLEAFDRPRPYGTEACHDPLLSEGRHDCRAVVLRWDTRRGNERDKKRGREKDREETVSRPHPGLFPVSGGLR